MTQQTDIRYIIDEALSQGRIYDAIELLRKAPSGGGALSLLQEAENTYRYMLQYMLQAADPMSDSSRPQMVAGVRESIRRCADMVHFAQCENTDFKDYFTTYRNRRSHGIGGMHTAINDTIQAIKQADVAYDSQGLIPEALHKALEQSSDILFQDIWTTQHLSASEVEALNGLLKLTDTPASLYVKSLVLAALLMSGIWYFDAAGLELLSLTALEAHDTAIKARALTGALLLASTYPQRVKDNPKVLAILSTVADDAQLASAIQKYVLSMLRALDTERVNKRVQDEIIPQIMKLKPEIDKQIRKSMMDISERDIEENPQWEELLSDTEISDTLKELSDMQMQGSDIFMSAFAQMKGYPFFRVTSNWFAPFTVHHSALAGVTSVMRPDIFTLLAEGSRLCTSDKYSMALSLTRMTPAQVELVNSQLMSQLDALKDEIDSASLMQQSDISREMDLYLKDLYRYFKLRADKERDPFNTGFQLPDIPPFAALRTDAKLLRSMAEFYFKYGYLSQAVELFRTIESQSETPQIEVLQKIGYALQRQGHADEALEAYTQAELSGDDSVWLMKRMAYLLRSMGEYERAAEYALRVIEHEDDNMSMEMLAGSSLMLAGKGQDALKHFYKIRYLQPENTAVLKPIAWSEFMLGHYEKSIDIYDHLPHVEASDMLNMGHAYLCSSHIPEAVRAWHTCMNMLGGDAAELRKLISDDKQYLKAAGVDDLTIALVTDMATASDL